MNFVNKNRRLSNVQRSDWRFAVGAGKVPDIENVRTYTDNVNLGTSFAYLTPAGTCPLPQVGGETQLRVKAGNANDTVAGSGAQLVFLEGLDNTGARITEVIPTNGTSAGVASAQSFLRLNHAIVVQSGTYGDPLVGSSAAEVVIENAAGTEDWLTLENDVPSRCLAWQGVYSVPLGYTVYLTVISTSVEGNKQAEGLFFVRQNILETAPPYSPVLRLLNAKDLEKTIEFPIEYPVRFPELSEFGLLGKFNSGSGKMANALSFLLVKD